MTINPKIKRLVNAIREDRIHGASQLARQAVQAIKTAVEHSQATSAEQFILEQNMIGHELMSARPAMAPLYNIISRLLNIISEKPADTSLAAIKQFIITKADEAINESLQAVNSVALYGSELMTNNDKVMTHSYSSTVIETLKAAFTKIENMEVIATRSGPGRTGERIALDLARWKIPVTFIDDTATGLYIAAVNKVMVGADRICADDKLINGIGTYPLSLASNRAGIPFYVLCETLKFDARLTSDEVDLEEKDTSEVIEPERLPVKVIVKNPYFDITPLELVTGIITEKGVLKPEEISVYMKEYS